MTKTLFPLMLLAAAVAMPLWMARCRKHGNRRWLLPWLATLLPLGVMLALSGMDLLPGGLDRTAASRLLIAAALTGTAAFAGGVLYLVIPILLGIASEAVLRGRMAEATAPKRTREDQREDEDNCSDAPWSISNTHRAYMGSYDGRNGYGIYADDD